MIKAPTGIHRSLLALLACGLLATAAHAQTAEKLPPGTKVAALEALPAAIDLKQPFAYTQLLLTGVLESGERIDVTRLARIEVPGQLVTITPTGLLRPRADGSGQLRASVGDKSATIP